MNKGSTGVPCMILGAKFTASEQSVTKRDLLTNQFIRLEGGYCDLSPTDPILSISHTFYLGVDPFRNLENFASYNGPPNTKKNVLSYFVGVPRYADPFGDNNVSYLLVYVGIPTSALSLAARIREGMTPVHLGVSVDADTPLSVL